MDIPEDVKKKIEDEVNKLKPNARAEGDMLRLLSASMCRFGYSLSQSEIKELKEEVGKLRNILADVGGEIIEDKKEWSEKVKILTDALNKVNDCNSVRCNNCDAIIKQALKETAKALKQP